MRQKRVIVASAGNRDAKGVAYPAHNPRVIGVGGINLTGGRWQSASIPGFGSSYGKALDFMAPAATPPIPPAPPAPGVPHIWTTGRNTNSTYVAFGGTSASCPIVAGLAALMISSDPIYLDEPGRLRVELGRGVLPIGDKPGFEKQTGAGIANGKRAVLSPVKSPPMGGPANLGIVVTRGHGSRSWVRRYDTAGNLVTEFEAYGPNYKKGLFVACGDLDGDGFSEIIVSRGKGGQSTIDIFDSSGNAWTPLPSIPGVFTKKRGIRVAAGTIGGVPVIVAGEGPGRTAGPRIDVYGFDSSCPLGTLLVDDFVAFSGSPGHDHGCHVAVVDVNGDGFDEIVVGSGAKDPDEIAVYSYSGSTCAPGIPGILVPFATPFDPWAGLSYYKSEVKGDHWVAGGDIDGIPGDEIVVGGGRYTGPEIQVFTWNGTAFTRMSRFLAYHPKFWSGASVAVGNLDADLEVEIVAGRQKRNMGHVRAFEADGWSYDLEFLSGKKSYRGMIRVATGIFP